MSKLYPNYVYGKSNQKIKSAYRVTLQKIACEENGFDENTTIEIKYEKNKITITKNATY